MLASLYGYAEIVKMLLEQEGIDVNVVDKNGLSAILLASANNKPEIVEILKNHDGIEYDEQRLTEIRNKPPFLLRGYSVKNSPFNNTFESSPWQKITTTTS